MNMNISSPIMTWPLQARPQILLVRRFYQDDQRFEHTYRSPFHTLHQYGYEARLRIGSQFFDLQPGDLSLTPKGVESSYDMPEGGSHMCIYFETGTYNRGDKVDLPLHLRAGPWSALAAQRIQRMARYGSLENACPVTDAAVSAALQELLLWMALRASEAPESPTQVRSAYAVDQTVAWIAGNLHLPISVPEIAEAVNLSQNYLARHFKHRFNMTIPHYILTYRIQQARYLLETTTLPIKEIGNCVGIPDPQHFNKQFRRLTGQSPTTYRSNNREKGDIIL